MPAPRTFNSARPKPVGECAHLRGRNVLPRRPLTAWRSAGSAARVPCMHCGEHDKSRLLFTSFKADHLSLADTSSGDLPHKRAGSGVGMEHDLAVYAVCTSADLDLQPLEKTIARLVDVVRGTLIVLLYDASQARDWAKEERGEIVRGLAGNAHRGISLDTLGALERIYEAVSISTRPCADVRPAVAGTHFNIEYIQAPGAGKRTMSALFVAPPEAVALQACNQAGHAVNDGSAWRCLLEMIKATPVNDQGLTFGQLPRALVESADHNLVVQDICSLNTVNPGESLLEPHTAPRVTAPIGRNWTVDGPAAPCNGPVSFSKVALGGTFDRLHAGHRLLLAAGALLARELLYVGITADKLLASKAHRELLQSYEERERWVLDFLRSVRPDIHVQTGALVDPKEPTAAATVADMQALVVSLETVPGGVAINEQRRGFGYPALSVVAVGIVGQQADGTKLSSSMLRSRQANQQPH